MQTPDHQNIENTAPDITISRLFEIGIASCESREPEKAEKVIHTLIDSLNFDYSDISDSFLKLDWLKMEITARLRRSCRHCDKPGMNRFSPQKIMQRIIRNGNW